MLEIKFITKAELFTRRLCPKVGRFTNISHHPFSPFSICTANRILTQAVPRINLIKISHSQIDIFIIFITFYLENFNADVAIMMKIWDIAALQRVIKVGGAKRVSSELHCINKSTFPLLYKNLNQGPCNLKIK